MSIENWRQSHFLSQSFFLGHNGWSFWSTTLNKNLHGFLSSWFHLVPYINTHTDNYFWYMPLSLSLIVDTLSLSDFHWEATPLVYPPSAICPTATIFVCSLNWSRSFQMGFIVISLNLSFPRNFLFNRPLSFKAFSFGSIFYRLEMKKCKNVGSVNTASSRILYSISITLTCNLSFS